ncbi:uncharacterized protein BJ212DRAFT_1480622 [Suillus subaureus]|uniref:Uncharacterized protein n=1 Tax=Suillus subaureus TaxID=48587 RepID=A0A9P7ECC7_9AGAM|nr:uncharacterized protein BJ212DRAFT_1480622 [Suillus subaureus]KAG1816765.1 hypothetical protein BJ212DRAFT_1480622 [Suillus subaureus]
MARTSASHKVGPARKAPPPCKVGPARIMKTNHKFSKLPDTLPIAEGSVEDGSPEPSPTNKDSGALADDNTVVDFTVDSPILFKKRKLHQHKTISSAYSNAVLPEASPEDSDYNDEEKSQSGSNNDDADKSPMPPGTQPQQADEDHVSPTPPARQAKGKGKQLPPPADDEEQHDNQHQADLDNSQQQVDLDENSGDSLMSGQLPQEAIDKAITLGDKTVAEAEKIAKEYGKSVQTILIQAGLVVKTTCADNSWNMYQAWYKMKHPKSSDMSTNDWKQLQRDHWVKHCDKCENPELWKEIHEFWDRSSKITEESSKVLYNRIMAVCNAFALSCQAYLCLEDIYVGGVFAGSPLILELVNKKQADIKELVDYLMTVIKYNCIDDTASLPSFTHFTALKFNPKLACEKGEGTCDHNHHVAPIMMLEKFEGAGIPHEVKNIPWKTMLNSLYLHQAQVVNWPAGVPPVGSNFVFKDLKTDELKALVGPYLKCCMGSDYSMELACVEHPELKKKRKDKLSGVKVPETELMFVPWSDESKDLMSNKDSTMLNIPLITNMDGKVQHTLMDCVLFMKNLLPSIEVLDSVGSPPRNSPTPQPSSPLVWSPSPPHRDHRKVMPLPHPIPTKVPPCQPLSQKAIIPMTISSSVTHTTVPLNNLVIIAHHHLFTILYAYTRESAPVAGPSRHATKAWVSPTEDEEEVEVEDGGYDHDYFKDYE